LPALRSDSSFRYLGDQEVEGRPMYVILFAQRPGRATATSQATGDSGTVLLLQQGIAWVDKSNFQIARMRTDLLAPRKDIGLETQTTELRLAEVQITDMPRPLWLPARVRVYTVFKGQHFRNEHTYTNYRRFRVAVKINP
jgi:hypothetical protein